MRLDGQHNTWKLIKADQRFLSRKWYVHVGVPSCFKNGDTLVEYNLSDREIMAA